MVFCVVAEGKLKSIKSLPECDVAVFGFNGLGEVDYEQELKGETDNFEDSVRLSRISHCGVMCGCRTNSRGVIKKSVAVADRGKLLGIADMNFVKDSEHFKGGASLGVYTVEGFRIGLCIENDLLFPDAFKAMSLCGCNAVVAVMEEITTTVPPLIMRTYSYLYGIPIIMCAGRAAYFSSPSGGLITSCRPVNLFEVNTNPQYHTVTMRTKGLCCDAGDDY